MLCAASLAGAGDSYVLACRPDIDGIVRLPDRANNDNYANLDNWCPFPASYSGIQYDYGPDKTTNTFGAGAAAPTFVAAAGATSAHLDFDGGDTLTTSRNPGTVGSNESFTITYWLNADVLGDFDMVCGVKEGASAYLTSYVLSSGTVRGYFEDDDGATELCAVGTIATGAWHFVAWTRDAGSTFKMWLDMTTDYDDEADATTKDLSTPSYALMVGARNDGAPDNHFDGQIDDWRWYESALSSNELWGIYNDTSAAHP